MTKLKPQVKEFNCETGEEIVRDATPDEIAQMKIDAANYEAKKTAQAEQAAQRQAILDRLGLTTDDLRALGL